MRRLFNNIYAKNFPATWDEKKLKDLFSQYGNINSLVTRQIEKDGAKSAYAFICYGPVKGNENENDKDYGPKCAAAACAALHDSVIEGNTIYVREALKKEDRLKEKQKEMLRYKNSKKRCNLYVKNFPSTTSSEDLKQHFGRFGEIESIKLFNSKEGEAVYAFVCFKNPDQATQAKMALHQQTYNGKQLYINHYEIKELRKVQQEDVRDKTDFQNYKKQNPINFSMDMINKPEMAQLIQTLFNLFNRH